MPDTPEADLLYGVPAIARHLGIRAGQVRGRIDTGDLPTFKIGGTICARPSTLAAWIAAQEAAARAREAGPTDE